MTQMPKRPKFSSLMSTKLATRSWAGQGVGLGVGSCARAFITARSGVARGPLLTRISLAVVCRPLGHSTSISEPSSSVTATVIASSPGMEQGRVRGKVVWGSALRWELIAQCDLSGRHLY